MAWYKKLGCNFSDQDRVGSVDLPRQQLIDPVDRMFGNMGQHVAQIILGVDLVELSSADETIDHGSTFATAVGAGK